MNKSQKILFNDNVKGSDMHFKVKLEQNVDSLQFLSMDVSTEDVYQNFNSDYGVLVGRVIANDGIGIPNAKISVFIALTDDDSTNSEISSIYPYKTPRDKNNEGKRYNLLPRVSKIDPITRQWKPKQPFGSLPIKEEIVTNIEYLDIYKKYYKYTALTNYAGDYMIFGVPTGTQTVHLSVDITDIGKYSMTPAAMVTNLGYSANLFTDNNTRIKPSNDLNDLPHIETQEISVEIIPFWGDTENFEIGITRQDFRIRSLLKNTFVIFGSAFTDGYNSMWGSDPNEHTRRISELYKLTSNLSENLGMISKRIGIISEKIYYYPNTITDADIDTGNVNPIDDMLILDKSEYSAYYRDGDFAFIINCNRDKIITDDNGNDISISDDSNEGVFTKFRGFITLTLEGSELNTNISIEMGSGCRLEPFRYRLKFPQYAPKNQSFQSTDDYRVENWRKQSFKFEANKFYSISKFNAIVYNPDTTDNSQFDLVDSFFRQDRINDITIGDDLTRNIGTIISGDDNENNNSIYQYPSNDGNNKSFGANWMNLTVHFPQIGGLVTTDGVRDVRFSDYVSEQRNRNSTFNNFYFYDNLQKIAAGDFNTKWFARSDLHWTDIIEVPLSDIQEMYLYDKKGFKLSELTGTTLTGTTYRNGVNIPTNPTINWNSACPFYGGRINAVPWNPADPDTYFYKGFSAANCIEYLYVLGIVT